MNEAESAITQVADAIHWGAWVHAFILIAAGVFLAVFARRGVTHFMKDRGSRHQTVMLRRLVFYVILGVFIMAAMREAGFAPDVLLGAAGILTVAIGFASQTSASNMISGLFLLVERPFEIGNIIEVEATIGEVVGIDMLSVKLRTPDNLYVRIPNETLIKTLVINRSRFPIRRLDLRVGIAYGEDVERTKTLLLELAEKSTACLREPRPFVLVRDFGPSSIDLQFSFWVLSAEVLEGRSEMMVLVKKALDEEGIEIPFPHTSIYAGSNSKPFKIELLNPDSPFQAGDPNANKTG
ncbi:MAG: mechanosensitive ion channel family protein [Oleiphilaceae bacterium]|nr:mechanosensitive ion channel family protein [Oleiphilaceae bacterium]